MPIELKVPSVGESITEVMIGEWLVKEGDHVEEDDPIVVIETDKVNVELPAPKSGTITKILKGDGEDAEVGEVVGLLEAGKAEESGDGEAEPKKAEPEKAEPEDEAQQDDSSEATGEGDEARVMPAAKKLLAQHGLEASAVEATGPGGRLLKEDVLRHVEAAGEKAAGEKKAKKQVKEKESQVPEPEAPGPEASEPEASEPEAPKETPAAGARDTERAKMTPLRRKVASRLVQAQEEAALLTTFNEIDMSAVMELRNRYKQAFQERYDIKLGFMSFFVKAAVEALKEIPQVNAQIDGDEVIYHNYQDIGVAVGGGKGLVVPVLRNAERMSFAEVEKSIADLAGRAQKGQLKLEELQGGTFTISNGGVYGSLLSTPIVNPPQSGILGLHKIEDRPIALDGQVVIRPMMYVALTYDHRIIDGREAVTFLIKIKERVEDPARIILEV